MTLVLCATWCGGARKEEHPEWFTPEADLDFDGFTNGEEYLYFQCEGKEAYAQAAFSPSLKPKALKSVYEAGESARMYVPEFTHPLTTYQWYKDGQPLTDDGVIVGATTRTLNILSLSEAHTGSYTCEWNDQNPNTKGTSTYAPITLRVAPQGEDPDAMLKTLLSNFDSLDTDGDGEVSLSELLRVIQLFNFEAFSCSASMEDSEDGYLPGNTEGDFSCTRHALDYDAFDWKSISLNCCALFSSTIQLVCMRVLTPIPKTAIARDRPTNRTTVETLQGGHRNCGRPFSFPPRWISQIIVRAILSLYVVSSARICTMPLYPRKLR